MTDHTLLDLSEKFPKDSSIQSERGSMTNSSLVKIGGEETSVRIG